MLILLTKMRKEASDDIYYAEILFTGMNVFVAFRTVEMRVRIQYHATCSGDKYMSAIGTGVKCNC